jgi:transcriptional regulator with XRE-family HTH domain
MITAEQLKAARKLLGWSQLALSLEASVAQKTVVGFETGKMRLSAAALSKILETLEGAGVGFSDGELIPQLPRRR